MLFVAAHLHLPEPPITDEIERHCFANCSSDRSLRGQLKQAENDLH